ncbi:unnamed protein product [Mortierella alpina]
MMAQSASGSESVSSAILSLLSAARSAPDPTATAAPSSSSSSTPASSSFSSSSPSSSSSSASSASADIPMHLVADPILSEPPQDQERATLPTQPASAFLNMTGITLSSEAFIKAALQLQQQLNSSAAAGSVESVLSQVMSTAASEPMPIDSTATTTTTTTTTTASTLTPTSTTTTTEIIPTAITAATETTESIATASATKKLSTSPKKLPSERRAFVSAVVIPPLKKSSNKPYALSNSPRTPSPSPSSTSSACSAMTRWILTPSEGQPPLLLLLLLLLLLPLCLPAPPGLLFTIEWKAKRIGSRSRRPTMLCSTRCLRCSHIPTKPSRPSYHSVLAAQKFRSKIGSLGGGHGHNWSNRISRRSRSSYRNSETRPKRW